jgi:predicted mannosyl-3-phosphoglycerate phosphatase (HAD superfamily)
MDNRPITIFCDIDGTLVIHSKPTDGIKKDIILF